MNPFQPTQKMYNSIITRGGRSVPTYAEVKRDARAASVDRYTLELF